MKSVLAVNDGSVYIGAGALGHGIIQPSRFMVADLIKEGGFATRMREEADDRIQTQTQDLFAKLIERTKRHYDEFKAGQRPAPPEPGRIS